MIKLISICFLLIFSCTTQRSFKPEIISKSELDINSINAENLYEYGNLAIIRDSWGIPHIYGKTDKDAAFGLAYAHAEDDFETIHSTLLHTRGEYASIYGKGKNNINASLDYLVGLLKIQETVNNDYYTKLDESTRILCEGYAEGLNYYIEKHHDTVKQYIYPVKGEDVVAGFMYKNPFFFDLPIFISVLFSSKPSDIPEVFTINDKIELITKGSNVFAVAPSRTNDNSTFLAINSHQPWEGDVAWYEAHIHSEEGLNITGGLFPGSPIILVGHNKNLGWGHTVNNPDIIDIYELEINPDNNNQYLFDGEWKNLEVFDVNININTIGKLGIIHTEPAYWSIHGPVIKGKHATYAIRYSWENNIKSVEQWYKMNKSNTLKEWKNALSTLAVPMFNSGYADKDGNIFYVYSAKLPIRSNEYNWRKVVPGNTSKTLWTDFYTFKQLPQLLNPKSGFIQNCNNTPYFTTDDNNPTFDIGDSYYTGIESTMTNRALRSMNLFKNDTNITYENFKKIKFDLQYSKDSYMAEYVNRTKQLILDADDEELSKAYEILDNWDFNTNKDNLYAALPIISFGQYVDSDPTVITDNMLMNNLKKSMKFLRKKFGSLKGLWGDINRLIRGNINLPLSGGPDILRAIYPNPNPTKDDQLKCIAGDAYMALVQWDKDGNLKSESIHQFGSAISNKSSEHYSDQAYLFSQEKLKPSLLELDEILKVAESIKVIY